MKSYIFIKNGTERNGTERNSSSPLFIKNSIKNV